VSQCSYTGADAGSPAIGSGTAADRQEVMIQSFPGDGPRKEVSTAGGETPSFSSDGKTVFYRLRDQLWAVPINTDPVLTIRNSRKS